MLFGMDMEKFYNEVVYVKSCGDFELYERRNGLRGIRINGKNHDITIHLIVNNNMNSEIHNFLMGCKKFFPHYKSEIQKTTKTMSSDEFWKTHVLVN